MNIKPPVRSGLSPDLDTQCASNESVHGESQNENPNGSIKSSNDETEDDFKQTPSAKQILLKYQCIPLHLTMEESRKELDSFLESYGNKSFVNLLGDRVNNHSIREHVIILHYLFSEFCTPSPSIESICNIVLLESRRVAALTGGGDKCLVGCKRTKIKDLPKEPVVHTSASSAQFVIAILRSPKACLFELPLDFILSLFRILMRLLSDEEDDEYDEECLFDWRFLEEGPNTKYPTKESCKKPQSNIDDPKHTKLDGSYKIVQTGQSLSRAQNKTSATKGVSSKKSTSFHRSQSTADLVTQAWTYANWKKKKSSPLYSTIRFCSNLAWRLPSSASKPSNRMSPRSRLNIVGESLKLDDDDDDDDDKEEEEEEEEESELDREIFIQDGSKFNISDVGVSRQTSASEMLGLLIKIYQSLIDDCSTTDHKCYNHLLLGPVAHLLGLIVAAVGVSVKDLQKLIVIAEGSDITNKLTKQRSRMSALSKSFTNYRHLARLHVIRMLRYAAEYSVPSGILEKAGPQEFFSFDGGKGLSATLLNTPWPFRYDFGMACWFRAETFLRAHFRNGTGDNTQSTVLFRARTQDGAQVQISFESCCCDSENIFATAATLLVTTTDACGPNMNQSPRKVRLVGCVLSPHVWYHVAVRFTRSKSGPFSLNFNKRNELSIFLNGKVMLKTHLKMPQFQESGGASLSRNLVGLGSFGMPIDNGDKADPVEVTFCSNFDGQAGSLYVFKELVSDETIQLLCQETTGHSEKSPIFTLSDEWDASGLKVGHIAKALSSASMLSELDNFILPDYPLLIGTVSRKRKVLIDLHEVDFASASAPTALSRASFGAKLLLVWDPSRVNNISVVDLHSGTHAKLNNKVFPWSFEKSIKETLLSLGGPKRLIPILTVLKENALIYDSRVDIKARGVDQEFPNMFIPSCLFLIASFIRDHEMNSREFYRCGAISVLHKILNDCKRRELENSSGAYYGMGSSLKVAKLNVSALLDLWQASRVVFGLNITVFSQLLFNVKLLFEGVTTCSGIHLHAVMLPVLSEITRQNPDKVRDCVGVTPFFSCIREYSKDYNDRDVIGNQAAERQIPFERLHHFHSEMTTLERFIVVDFMFGMIAMMLAKSCSVDDLTPLVTFLTHNLDIMRQQDNQNAKISLGQTLIVKKTEGKDTRSSKYWATLKALNVLFYLLQKSPLTPNTVESLTSLLESADGVASWMLCCMVNSFDDTLRGLGVKCLVAYLHATLDFTAGQDGSTIKLSNAVKYGLGVISNSSTVFANLLAGHGNVKVIYKLLWHLLRCHRDRLGDSSNLGLMYLLVDYSSSTLSDLVVANKYFIGGFLLDVESFNLSQSRINTAATLSRQSIRNKFGVSVILRLLRFIPNDQKERWLFDLLALLMASPDSIAVILSCDEWQSCLFQLVAEVLEEINGKDSGDNGSSNHSRDSATATSSKPDAVRKFDTKALSKPSVRTRYDLSLKLYSGLLGHCVRRGGDKAFESVETAASLQRVDINGPQIFGIILSHLLADLIEKGTVESVEGTYQKGSPNIKNRALKQSARLVTQAILSNGSGGSLDMAAAVKQWRSLRHLTALTVAVVTDFGFGITDLFDYQLQDGASIDAITGGVYGIRLGDNLVSGINAFEALASAQLQMTDERGSSRTLRNQHRYTSVVLVSQMLTLLDAFIFPDNLDSSASATQLHGLALVRSSEPRLGQSQGPLLASLVRLSIVLLHFLEPCSVRFLQACSRLRCFLHWTLEIIRESVALGGCSSAFHELTAPLDRLVLVIVLHCHRALSRCSTLLVEIESLPWDTYFPDISSQKKCHRRLLRAILELREIVIAAYRGRNEVLRASLSQDAHAALSICLEGGELLNPKKAVDQPKNSPSREHCLRTFLLNKWVSGFHDVQVIDNIIMPESVGPLVGKEAFLTLVSESTVIVKDYKTVLNSPWKAFCENQRRWAETDAVLEMEQSGDMFVKKLSSKERSDIAETSKVLIADFELASKRFSDLFRLAHEPWDENVHWQCSSCTDLLFRRILLSRNLDFNDHRQASYELTLGKDKEQAKEEEKLMREQQIKEVFLHAGEAILPYQEDDVEDDDLEENIVECGESEQNDKCKVDENGLLVEDKSITHAGDDKSNLDWDQLDFDEIGDCSNPYFWAKKFVWAEGETFVQSFEAVVLVTLRNNTNGTLLLTSHNLYFHQTGEVIDVMTREKVESTVQDKKWRLDRLTDIHGRRYMLRAHALELFFVDMHGVFIAFNGSAERDLFFSKIRTNCAAPLLRPLKTINPRKIFKKSKITELWRKRKLSNFQYLMALNLMAGRTFNDITQYPVFPWILADYYSEEIDLSDHRIYRDLSKPVGALNPDRLASFVERYNELDGFPEEEKFLYGSHYSSPGVVLHYMVRQEPFTTMHIALQSGRFDCPDRLFFDIGGCWRSCLSSTSDVKELIPEFFTCPEILLNTNAFPLGETQNKIPVDDVILPPWAKGSAHEFVRIHRLALESEYVSENLHHWIDLIFGFKQRGPASTAAHNIFHYLSYEGSVDIEKITDSVQRNAIEGHIQNFGQTPSQLIVKDPHPSRLPPNPVLGELFHEMVGGYENLQCYTPTQQFGMQRYEEANVAIVSLHFQGDSVLAIHSDFTLCSYKFYPQTQGAHPFQLKTHKIRKLDYKSSIYAHSSASHVQESSFALAKGGIDKSDEPGSSITDVSLFLMSVGYYDNSIKVHNTSTDKQSTINGIHRGQINCIQVSADGTIVVTGGEDSTCIVWVIDYEDFAKSIANDVLQPGERSAGEYLRCCHVLLGHTTPVTCLAISTKLDIVISGSKDGSICLHNIRSGKFIRSLHIDALSHEVVNSCVGNAIPVIKLALHSDGIFVVHLADRSLHVITVNGHRLAKAYVGELLNSIVLCSHTSTLITGGEQGFTKIWNIHDLCVKCSIDLSRYGQIRSMVLVPSDHSPKAQYLCVGSENGLMSVVFKNLEWK